MINPLLISELLDNIDRLQKNCIQCLKIDLKLHYKENRENNRTTIAANKLVDAGVSLEYSTVFVTRNNAPRVKNFEDLCFRNYEKLTALTNEISDHINNNTETLSDDQAMVALEHIKDGLKTLQD